MCAGRSRPDELARLLAAGARVFEWGVPRVWLPSQDLPVRRTVGNDPCPSAVWLLSPLGRFRFAPPPRGGPAACGGLA